MGRGISMPRETGRVDRKEGGNGEGDLYNGMPGWA